MDFFNHPVREKLLPFIHHMEHGIKVNKNKVITHKYNFGVPVRNWHLNIMYDCILSIGYSKEIALEILNYMKTCKNPYSGFGIENNQIEFYIESVDTIYSWNLSNNIKYIYKYINLPSAYAIIDNHIDIQLCKKFKNLIHEIYFIYNKTLLSNDKNGDIFNFYFKNKNPQKVINVKDDLIELLYIINKDSQIKEYISRYDNWYLVWLHISKKQDGSIQITPYFRSKSY